MISEGVLSRRFVPAAKLPSSRKLATHLAISRITVTLACRELVSDDYLVARGRSGISTRWWRAWARPTGAGAR